MFAPKTADLTPLSARQRRAVGVGPVEADLARQPPVGAGRGQRRTGPRAFDALCVVEGTPLRAMVDRTILQDEPAVVTDRLDTVRVDDPTALGTAAAGPLGGGNVLVECPLVDGSQ
jgi:hypothetical protein